MQELKPIKEGKVREIYDNGDSLIMVATDRISCFDVILHNEVTKKGTVLTQMSKFWFDMTKDILPNHMISVDVKDMPEFFQQPKYEGKSMMCKKLQDAADRVYRPRIHHRKRLGKLQREWNRLWYYSSRRPERVRQASGADLHSVHQG